MKDYNVCNKLINIGINEILTFTAKISESNKNNLAMTRIKLISKYQFLQIG